MSRDRPAGRVRPAGDSDERVPMNLRQLNYFVAIGEAQSVTRAARHLRIAQPALTRQLKDLESRIGATLTVRSGRGIALTEAGQHLLTRVRPLLQELRQVQADVVGLSHRPLELTLGVPSALAGLGDRLIERAAALPGTCRLQIVDGRSRFIADWLVAGQLDVGLIYDHTCDDPAIEMLPVAAEEHYVIGPAGDARAAETEIDIAELAELPLIMPSRNHGLRRFADVQLAATGLSIEPIMEIDSIATIKKLVERGRGYAIVSQSDILFTPMDGLRARRIAPPGFVRTLSLAWRHEAAAVSRALRVALQDEIGEIIVDGTWGTKHE